MLYSVTAHPSNSVSNTLVSSLTGTHQHLLVAKTHTLETYQSSSTTLTLLHKLPFNGRILQMQMLGSRVCVLTEKGGIVVLEWIDGKRGWSVYAKGDVSDKGARASECGSIMLSGPQCITIYQSQGLLKVIPIGREDRISESFNVRLDKLDVISMTWADLGGSEELVVLYQDVKEVRYVQSYKLSVKEKELISGRLFRKVDQGAIFVMRVTGGVVVVSPQTVMFMDDTVVTSSFMKATIMTSHTKIDASRFLMGDYEGVLYMMSLGVMKSLNVVRLGVTCQSSCLSYVSDGMIFIGSHFGDSQLVKVDGDKEGVEVLQTFVNLSPITDFCVVDRDGQSQVVACSGAYKDGSLRIVRSGIGISELGQIEVDGLMSIFGLDNKLILSYVNSSILLVAEEGEADKFNVREVVEGVLMSRGERTLNAFEWDAGVVQVTVNGVFYNNKTFSSAVSHSSYNNSLLMLAYENDVVILDKKLAVQAQISMEYQVSCLCMNQNYAVLGQWNNTSFAILSLDTFKVVRTEVMESIPRCVLLASLELKEYLFVALGDGTLHTFSFSTLTDMSSKAVERRKTVLGTQPATLSPFQSNGITYIFASSDRPTVIYSNNEKLQFSNVNLKSVIAVSTFNQSLALVTDGSLLIGQIEAVQKLHVKKVPVGETCRRIIHHDLYFGVLTASTLIRGNSILEQYNIKLFDSSTFEIVDSHTLDEYEMATSIHSTLIDSTLYLVVGTGYCYPTEDEPRAGRLLLFTTTNKKIQLTHSFKLSGCAYSIVSLHNRLIVACNSKVIVFEITPTSIILETTHHGHVLALALAVRGDLVIVGDLLKSITCLFYDPINKQLTEHARDLESHWITAIESLNSNSFIAADNQYNLFTLSKEEGSNRLMMKARFHVGELINRFRSGALVLAGDSSSIAEPLLLYATVSGSLCVLAELNEQVVELSKKLQEAMRSLEQKCGMKVEEWRAFEGLGGRQPDEGVIDGDLIESFVELDLLVQIGVAKKCGVDVTVLASLVEDLKRMH